MPDMIKVTILEDGTIKTETDQISAANHANATGFIQQMFTLVGGAVSRVMKPRVAQKTRIVETNQ